jgi:hypothetical protein
MNILGRRVQCDTETQVLRPLLGHFFWLAGWLSAKAN